VSEVLTLAHFKDLDQKTCTVRAGEETLELKLDAVVPKERQPQGYECFTLIFKGPGNLMLPQAIYQIEFAEDKTYPLFLVPVDGTKEFVEYEAVFSRKLDSE